jgi:hypothetical protein
MTNDAQPEIDRRLKEFENLNIQTYKFIIENAKERLDYLMSEAESITDKSIKMLTVISTLLGLFIGVILKDGVINNHYLMILLGFLFIAISAGSCIRSILSKKTVALGLSPKNILGDGVFDEISKTIGKEKNYLEIKAYYTSVILLQGNINFMLKTQPKRARIYNTAVRLFFITLIILPLIAISIIYRS